MVLGPTVQTWLKDLPIGGESPQTSLVTNHTTVRVYLVDDHEVVRRGVASLLESDGDIQVVGEAGTVSTAVQEILHLRPDVVVLDHSLPDGSGIDVCCELRASAPEVRVLMLTSYDDTETISAAMLAGASGYILKNVAGDSLVSGVRLVAGGHSLLDPAVAGRVVEQMETQRRSMDLIGDLTPQQRKIFFLIAQGLTNRQIAERLYLAEKTVKNHVTGVLGKLGLQHRTQAALLAVRVKGADGARQAAQEASRPERSVPARRSVTAA